MSNKISVEEKEARRKIYNDGMAFGSSNGSTAQLSKEAKDIIERWLEGDIDTETMDELMLNFIKSR